MAWFVVTLLLCVLLACSAEGNSISKLSNVACQPLLSYIQVNEHHRYDPYVVKLHRCTGKNSFRSHNRVCAPKRIEEVTFYVDDFSGRPEPATVTLKNHTSCQEECRDDGSVCNQDQSWNKDMCSCTCNVKGSKQCEEGFRWDPFHCACRCPKEGRPLQCGKHKLFSEEACGCICDRQRFRRCSKKGLYMDPETCYCTSTPPTLGAQDGNSCVDENQVISKAGLAVVTMIEALLIIGGYFMWIKYCSKRNMCEKVSVHNKFGGRHYQSKPPRARSDTADTPTIELQYSIAQAQPLQKNNSTNNNKPYGGGHTSSSSCDALLREQSSEYLHDERNDESYDWRASLGSMTKV